MKKIISIFLAFIITSSMVYASDSPMSSWAETDIKSAIRNGLIKGDETEDYTKQIHRAEFTEIICSMYENLSSKSEKKPENGEYKATGDAGFVLTKPSVPLTEYEEKIFPFTDTENNSVKKMWELGVVSGVSETEFAPEAEITIEEAITILMRTVLKLYPDRNKYIHAEYKFIDEDKISYWAKNWIDYAYWCGILKGTEEYVINPERILTWEESIALAVRTIRNIDYYMKEDKGYSGWEWYIEPKYDGLVPNTKFQQGRAVVSYKGKYGYIDTGGNEVIPCEYDNTWGFSGGLAKVEKDGKIGYINRNGQVCIDFLYEDGGECTDGVVWVVNDNKVGYLNTNGEVVIPFVYEKAYPFSEGSAAVKKDGLYGFIDKNNNTVIDFKFKWASSFKEGRARVGDGALYGFIDKSGSIVIPCQYEMVFDFKDGVAVVMEAGTWAFFDYDGNLARGTEFYKIFDLCDSGNGLFFVREDVEEVNYGGDSYYVDIETGQKIRSGTYVANRYFHEGLMADMRVSVVNGRNMPYYLDTNNEYVIPPQIDYHKFTEEENNLYQFMDFSEGLAAVVNKQGKLGFIKNPLLADR